MKPVVTFTVVMFPERTKPGGSEALLVRSQAK